MTLGQSHDTTLGHGQQLCDILSRSNMAVRSYRPDTHILLCVHCDLGLGDMTLGQGHDTPLVQGHDTPWGHGQQLCDIFSRSNIAVRSYGPDTHILLCVHCDLNLGGMTLSQGHDTPLGHGQQLCEILSRSNMAVRSYGPDTELGYVCTVALTLEV